MTDERRSALIGMALALCLAIALPLLFADMTLRALHKLHLTPTTAMAIALAIFAGGLVNVPVWRVPADDWLHAHPLSPFGMERAAPNLRRSRKETIVAVNLGGCLIPVGLALYELIRLPPAAAIPCSVTILASVVVCYFFATPVPGVGIVMPLGAPALTASVFALALAPENAPPIAFAAGALGPLIGADLLHLRAALRGVTSMASIGGAGTFDGIVLSALIAAYLS